MDLSESLRLLPLAIASERSAAALWEALSPAPATPELIVSRACRRTLAGVTVRRLDLKPGDWTLRQGLRVTSPLRTALDCGRRLPLADAVPIIDALLMDGRFTGESLTTAARGARGPGASRLHAAVAASEASGSFLESTARLVFREAGLVVVPQYRLTVDGHTYDFAIVAYRILIEIEGFAFHSTRDQLDRDAMHASEAAAAGWWLLRFTWEDIMLRPDAVVATVRRAMSEAAATIGSL